MKGDEIQTMIVEVTEEGDLIQVEDCSLQLEDLTAIQCTDLPLAEEVRVGIVSFTFQFNLEQFAVDYEIITENN